MRYCIHCASPLEEGMVCSCPKAQAELRYACQPPPVNQQAQLQYAYPSPPANQQTELQYAYQPPPVNQQAELQYAYRPPPVSPQDINRVRHRAEKPLFVVYVVINIAIVLGAIFFSLDFSFLDETLSNEFLFTMVFLAPFLLWVTVYYFHAMTRAYAIRVSERNFPEIYQKSLEFAERLQLKRVPPVYIEQQNGIINAFAAAIIGKPYISLNAEVVDIAYMEHRDFAPIYFILAHEFGHVYFRHVRFLYNLLLFLTSLIPFVNSTLSRSREYSCDRVAQLLTGRDGVQEMLVLTAGRHLYKYVDAQDYLINAKKEKGLYLWVVNLLTTHPITIKRISALADPDKKSGKLF